MAKFKSDLEVSLPENLKAELRQPGAKKKVIDLIRQSTEEQVRLLNPTDFYKEFNTPKQSKVWDFIADIKSNKKGVGLSPSQLSFLMEFNLNDGRYRLRRMNGIDDVKASIALAEKNAEKVMRLQEHQFANSLKKVKEDFFDGFADQGIQSQTGNAFPNRFEYTPLLGTPFFKQLYLYDYLLMHSKAFWYRNYSGIAKAIVDMTRNFVIGKGFSVTIEDQKALDAWNRYADRSDINDKIRLWCDELSVFGELMIKKVVTPKGINHITVDPSTIWEIVTDPQNIYDIKYFHQQYNTQYQIFTAPGTPSSEYVIQHIPPSLMRHYKVNVTSYEKRGRSDLLAPMLYMKYFEDYMTSELIRKKNEAAFIWDVTVDGSDEDIANYINSTQSIVDVPPGSENVHNKAIERKPLSPSFSARGPEDTAKTIVAYIAMSASIPAEYLAFAGSATKASALVKTEPAVKKMEERRQVIENILNDIFEDVMVAEGIDPDKVEVEFNFPEIIEEDRSSKIADVYLARDNGSVSHRRASEIVAKELNVTNYDFEKEMASIEEERSEGEPFLLDKEPAQGADAPLTQGATGPDTQDSRTFDRSSARKSNTSL